MSTENPECPMTIPRNCKLIDVPGTCAFVREDKVCKKVKKKTRAEKRAEKKERLSQ